MTDSPPTHPDAEQADQAARSVQDQLDALLVQIETAEPGTVDPSLLPEGFVSEQASAPAAPSEAAQAFEEALTADKTPSELGADAVPDDEGGGEAKSDVESAAEQEMLAMLNQSLAGVNADTPAKANDEPPIQADDAAETTEEPDQAPAEPTTPAPAAGSETDMLAELNAALQDLNPDAPGVTDETPQDDPAGDLQDEINALLDQPAQPTDASTLASETPNEPGDDADTASAAVSTEDQIAQEIEGLLDASAGAEPAKGEPTIDDLDQMLADEIDEDDELAGDFQSVEDITAGIVTDEDEAVEVDEHAASAQDVAAELDTQPEDAPAEQEAHATIAAISETVQRQADAEEAEQARDWRGMLLRAKRRLLEACFMINWPARRFLSPEYRATLGYIALLNLFFAVAIWFAIVLF